MGGACTFWGERSRPLALAAGVGARRVQPLLTLGSDGLVGVLCGWGKVFLRVSQPQIVAETLPPPKKWATLQGHSCWHSRRASPAHPSGHTALWRHEANEAQCSGSKKRCLFTCILVVMFLFRGWKRPAWGSAPWGAPREIGATAAGGHVPHPSASCSLEHLTTTRTRGASGHRLKKNPRTIQVRWC